VLSENKKKKQLLVETVPKIGGSVKVGKKEKSKTSKVKEPM
jgi:hypothetical protein